MPLCQSHLLLLNGCCPGSLLRFHVPTKLGCNTSAFPPSYKHQLLSRCHSNLSHAHSSRLIAFPNLPYNTCVHRNKSRVLSHNLHAMHPPLRSASVSSGCCQAACTSPPAPAPVPVPVPVPAAQPLLNPYLTLCCHCLQPPASPSGPALPLPLPHCLALRACAATASAIPPTGHTPPQDLFKTPKHSPAPRRTVLSSAMLLFTAASSPSSSRIRCCVSPSAAERGQVDGAVGRRVGGQAVKVRAWENASPPNAGG